MILAEDLKKSILQYALEGKLSKRLKTDSSINDLLKSIREKKKNIKEPNLYDFDMLEIPFEIPSNWVWVQIGELFTYQNGYAYNSHDMSKNKQGIPVIKSNNLMTLKVVINTKTDYVSSPNEKMMLSKIEDGDLLMCLSSQSSNPEPLGKTAIYDLGIPALLNQRVLKMKLVDMRMLKYIYYVINSEYFHYNVSHQGGGSAQSNLKLEHVRNMLIPLPPIEEQQRIVEKLEEILPLIDEYSVMEQKLQDIQTAFPEDMKKAILQYAMQGKMVAQDESDEPASVLLKKIRQEKIQLTLDGKLKKERPSSPITDDEIPFDIPETWEWVRLGQILNKLTDGTHSTPKYTSKGIPFISVKDVSAGELSFDSCKYISKEESEELNKRCNPEYGDILLTKVGTTGVPVIVDTDKPFSLFVSVALLKFNNSLIYNRFLVDLILSPVVQKQAAENTKGVGNKNWVMKDIANTLIPLPPYNEQIRIVEKLDEILSLIEELKV